MVLPRCLSNFRAIRSLKHPVSRLRVIMKFSGKTMMTSSNGTIFRVTGPLCGEFTGPGEFPAQWPVTRSFDVFFDLRLNKRLSKQSWGWWFETPPWSLWRQCNASYRLVNRGPGWGPCLPRSFDMTLTLTVYCSGVIKQDFGLLIIFPFKNGHSVLQTQ